jgi:hypothetical protein
MYYVEIRSTVRRSGPPRLVPLDEVGQHTGFRSIVCYDEATAERIRADGGTKGLRGVPVYADTLFMDFDNIEPVEFRKWLIASNLAFEEWDTGNRSVHFHIPMTPVFGSWVPDAMRAWVVANSPEKADTSFYHAAGQYRLPLTFHYKSPGKIKQLVYRREGELLTLTAPPPKVRAFSMHEDPETHSAQFFVMLLAPMGTGGRHLYVWRLAMCGAKAGMEFDETLKHLEWWNGRMCTPPLEPYILIKQCESAYQRVESDR